MHDGLTVLHQKLIAVWNDWSGTVGWWDARLGETFDMFGHVPGNHRVHQLGHALDNRHLDHIARISTDAGLMKLCENGTFYPQAGENDLVIDELLLRIVLLHHRQQLHDIGIL